MKILLIRITVYNTIVADDDKVIKQIIVTERLGQLEGWPTIKAPSHDSNKKQVDLLSGKIFMIESLGNFSCELSVSHWRNENDLQLIQDLYFARQGFLIWISGGNDDQFFFKGEGYKKEDLYFVRPTNAFTPEYVKGIYNSGMNIKIKLTEVIE